MSLSLSLPQFPNFKIHIHKFTGVKNSATLKAKLLDADPAYNFALINAQTVLSLEQLSAALYRAILDYTGDRIRTRLLHSECVFALSPTQNIIDGLRRFGIQDDTEDIVAIKVIQEGKDDAEYDISVVEGDEVPVTDETFQKTANVAIIKKNYKIQTEDVKIMTRQIVGAIQLRGH